MMGWRIFKHSVQMVLRNFQQALQIALVPGLIGMALLVGLSMVTGTWDSFQSAASDLNPNPTGDEFSGFGAFGLLALVIFAVIVFWVVVSWHRYVLLEEMPQGWLPPFRGDRILAYFGLLLMLFGFIVIAAIPFVILLALLGGASGGMFGILMFVFVLFVGLCLYRLSIVLPASAIGQPLRLSEAWSKTQGTFGVLLVLTFVSWIFQFLVQMLFAFLLAIPVIGFALVLIPSILILPLINVSTLTTLYGVYVEGREID